MTKKFGDIDIDVRNRNDILSLIEHIPASIVQKGDLVSHKTGIYLQDIPIDPTLNISSINYEKAEEMGYIKLDFINMGAYANVRDQKHLEDILEREVPWEVFENEEIVKKLYHLHNYFELVQRKKPTSIDHLAMLLGLIRPGKKHLINKSWEEIEESIWTKDDNGYSFKKSHAYAYATAIIVQLHTLLEKTE